MTEGVQSTHESLKNPLQTSEQVRDEHIANSTELFVMSGTVFGLSALFAPKAPLGVVVGAGLFAGGVFKRVYAEIEYRNAKIGRAHV